METLLQIGLGNALVASVLAVVAAGVGRYCRRPALVQRAAHAPARLLVERFRRFPALGSADHGLDGRPGPDGDHGSTVEFGEKRSLDGEAARTSRHEQTGLRRPSDGSHT